MAEEKKAISLLERMKLQAQNQETYYKTIEKAASVGVVACPNCGAGRAKYEGVTKCAYCGFLFIENKLSDGINIKKEDNSK